MAITYGNFEMPENIKLEEKTSTPTFARFIAEPFERGYGHTIGNALRRMIMTSLEAPAITSVRIEGVPHEYMAIDGIIEDMVNIVLNFKGALLRRIPTDEERGSREPRVITARLDVTQKDIDSNGGQHEVKLGDLITNDFYEVINPELHLFTVTSPQHRDINIRVSIGRGYVPSERHNVPDKLVDEILIDSSFSPVRLVNYQVENTRVGMDTDYDRLLLDVHTDGRITPTEALIFAAQIGVKHFDVFNQLASMEVTFSEIDEEGESKEDELLHKLILRIDEIELSVRSTNCLSSANIDTIAELVTIPERRMLEFRNFGKKSLNEIKAKLNEIELSLGMDLSY